MIEIDTSVGRYKYLGPCTIFRHYMKHLTIADLCILQILGWPILHAEQDALQEVEAKNGETLE